MSLEDWKFALTALFSAVVTGLVVWAKASKTRATVSGDTLQVMENESRGAWIAKLELRVAEEQILRAASEKRERETHALYMETKGELERVKDKLSRVDRRVELITELLLIERPDLASAVELTRSTAMGSL